VDPDILLKNGRSAALGQGYGAVAPYAGSMGVISDEGVLITGVYGAGKSTVAAEISYLLEQRRQPYALLDLDYLGWGVNSFDGPAAESPFLLRNLAAVVSNYREGGISVFVLAYFVSSREELQGIREAVGVPLRVVRLSVPLAAIEQRLAADVTTERREELREAARQIAAGEGVGVEDVALANDRPVPVVAEQLMTWLGWV
jgi:Adenylylsulphate kinase